MTLRQRLINSMLRHEGLVAVPEEWQTEYVKLAGEKVRNKQAIVEIVKEYNSLLHDYYEKYSIKDLKDLIKDSNIKEPISQLSKDELVELAYNEYKMSFKKE